MLTDIVNRTFDEQVTDLKALLSIPSVSRGEPQPGMPLGKPVHDALACMLDTAKRLGFPNARSLDGYCGTVDYGEGDEMLMIMTHLDVVPAGPAWTSDPFTPVVRDGKLFARGAIDDKGPAMNSLYALYAVKEAGIPLKRRVRLLFGCDEERGWQCIDRYKQTETEPDLAFTPDGSYPLVHSERGICHVTYARPMQHSGVRIACGEAANVIPGEASAHLPFAPVPCAAPEGIELVMDGQTLTAIGRGGHGAYPEGARNALLGLLEALSQQPLDTDDLAVATSLHALLGQDMHAEGFGLDITDASGRITLSPNMLHWDGNRVSLTMDCRYPFTLTTERLLDTFDETFAALGFTRTYTKQTDGHFISPDSELVRTLLDIYEAHTGKKADPLCIGGGTYARSFQNAVAFGAEPADDISVCHMPDEYIALEDIRFNTLVMAEAIERLAGK